MVRYNVAFTVNGTIMTINVEKVKLGNRYLQCMDDTRKNDNSTVAMIPFDAVEYIVFENITLSADELATGEGDALETHVAADDVKTPDA